MNRNTLLKTKKTFKWLLPVVYIGVVILIGLKVAVYILPFILAFALSSAMEPLIRLLENRLNLSRKLASAFSILLIFSLLLLIIALAVSRLARELLQFSHTLPHHLIEFQKNIDGIFQKLTDIYIQLPSGVAKNVDLLLSGGSVKITGLLNSSIDFIFSFAASIPQFLIFITVTLLSTYFFASDKDRITYSIKSAIPRRMIQPVVRMRIQVFGALLGYIKAQLILMFITFIELFMGFLLIGVNSPFLLALLISFIDALPVLGTGSVLVPWLLYGFLIGNLRLGFSLLILYIIVILVRQMAEPKILSHQIGIHPIFTLMAMYIGLKLFGILGMILGPITVIVLKNILSGMKSTIL